jgi:hypothetical protein
MRSTPCAGTRWPGPTSPLRSGTRASWWRSGVRPRSSNACPTCSAGTSSRPAARSSGRGRPAAGAGPRRSTRSGAFARRPAVPVRQRPLRARPPDRPRRALGLRRPAARQPAPRLCALPADRTGAGGRQRAPDQDRGALPRRPRRPPGRAACGGRCTGAHAGIRGAGACGRTLPQRPPIDRTGRTCRRPAGQPRLDLAERARHGRPLEPAPTLARRRPQRPEAAAGCRPGPPCAASREPPRATPPPPARGRTPAWPLGRAIAQIAGVYVLAENAPRAGGRRHARGARAHRVRTPQTV